MRVMQRLLVSIALSMLATAPATAQAIENADGVCHAFLLQKRMNCVHELGRLRAEQRKLLVLFTDRKVALSALFSSSFAKMITRRYEYDMGFRDWGRSYSDAIPRR